VALPPLLLLTGARGQKRNVVGQADIPNTPTGLRAGTILVTPKARKPLHDIGYKSEGVISIHEFYDANGAVNVAVGDRVDVLVESPRRTSTGSSCSPRRRPTSSSIWDEISQGVRA
jgi:ribosomal protein S1